MVVKCIDTLGCKLGVFFNEGISKLLWKNTGHILMYLKLLFSFLVSLLAVFETFKWCTEYESSWKNRYYSDKMSI